jgi:hypothetical protein
VTEETVVLPQVVIPEPNKRRYVVGACRNSPEARTHTYVYDTNGDLWPMCEYGWNRGDGDSFSILRSPGSHSGCSLCCRAVAQAQQPVLVPRGHKTRWL